MNENFLETFRSSLDHPTVIDTKGIMKILPHRYPFLLVDRIIKIDVEAGLIIGQKGVTMNEEFFQGHFPEAPIMPGVLILEALAQTGGVLIHQKGFTDRLAVLLSMQDVKFRNPVKPGDTLFLCVEGLHLGQKGGKTKATAIVRDKIAVQAEIGFALVDKSQV